MNSGCRGTPGSRRDGLGARRRAAALAAVLALTLAAGRAAAPQEPAADETVLGSASALRIESGEAGAVTLAAGTRLHREPHHHAAVVTVVDVEVTLEPLERLDAWVRVRFGERVGWAARREPPAPAEPPPGPPPPPAPSAPPPARLSADPERLARAVSLLGERAEPVAAGPFQVYTDLASERKRQLLLRAAGHLTDAYRQRYGLAPQREASFAVVIFERQESYREFASSLADLARLDAQGHAGSGIAALVAGSRAPTEIAALLVHELTHLLNRQTFRASLPPWLEEGIANDLAYCQLDRAGRLEPGTLGGRGFIAEIPGPPDRFGVRGFSGTIHIEGPVASLSLLKRSVAAGESVPLPELLDLTWREFVEPRGRQLRYVESTFLVRYLLDELDGSGLRGFLAAYQAGSEGGPATLLTALGLDWQELTAGFHRWIRLHTGRR